jgi:hypothetical protein
MKSDRYETTISRFPGAGRGGVTTATGTSPLSPEDLVLCRVSQKSAVFRQSQHPMFTVRPIRSGTVAERGRQMNERKE